MHVETSLFSVRQKYSQSIALVLVSIAAIAMSQFYLFKPYTTLLVSVALLLQVAACALALKNSREQGNSRFIVAVSTALVFAMLAFIMPRPAAAQALASFNFDPQGDSASTTSVQVQEVTANLSPTRVSSLVEQIALENAKLTELPSDAASQWVNAAKDSGYTVQSGLEPDFDNARVTSTEDGYVIVSVPLLGTNLPEVSTVTYMSLGDITAITEISANLIDADHVSMQMWNDGNLTTDLILTNPEPGVMERGVNWTTLNNCLNSIGISWAVIAVLGVACGVACATFVLCAPCLAAAAGFTGGTIAGCVSIAWE